MEQNYQNIEDFLQDESFVSWVKGNSDEAAGFWEKWAAENRASAQLMEEAKCIIKGIPFVPAKIEADELTDQLQRLQKAIGQGAKEIPMPKKKKFIPLKWAAILLLLISSSYFLYQFLNSPEFLLHKTNFAETKEIVLDDGSRIFLNANSQIWYERGMKENGIKELWLEGEAYFDIKPQEKGFYRIYAGNMQAQIIGTSFNLNARKESSVLSLDEGKVLVSHLSGVKQEIDAGTTIFFEKETQAFIQQSDRNSFWNSWREQLWILDAETSFGDILDRIEAEFGLHAKLKDESLRQRSLEGSVPIENMDVLLESLSYIFEIEIKRAKDSVLYIE
ncbi:MAG: FecR family protein [Bacteroidota bacterium]